MASSSSFSVGGYAAAYGLVGFGRGRTHLRVRIERFDDRYVWVRTADLRDAGTPLVLNHDQVVMEEYDPPVRHKDGLVEIG